MTLDNDSLNKKWWFAIPTLLAAIFSNEPVFKLAGYDTTKEILVSELLFNTSYIAEIVIGFSVFFTLWRLYSFLGGVLVRILYTRLFKHQESKGT